MDGAPEPTQPAKLTAVRLPAAMIREADALVGRSNRSKFIMTAVERDLKRQARLSHISTSEGLIGDELDTLEFVNHLRTLDDRSKA